MLDRDLAKLYGVSTRALNQGVKRNSKRFPDDFMFKLSKHEKDELVTVCDRFKTLKHSSVNPHAFTEQGVAMLSSVLNSERAVMVNIQIMRTFVNLRRIALTYIGLKRKIESMEKNYDAQFQIVFKAIKRLIMPPPAKKRKIGFHVKKF